MTYWFKVYYPNRIETVAQPYHKTLERAYHAVRTMHEKAIRIVAIKEPENMDDTQIAKALDAIQRK